MHIIFRMPALALSVDTASKLVNIVQGWKLVY